MANQLTKLITGNLFKNEEKKGGALTTMPSAGTGVPTPDNPGQIVPCQSAPIVTKPTYFSPLVADAITRYADKKKAQVKSTAQAYKGLSEVSTADFQVGEMHNKYLIHAASNGVKQVKSQAAVKGHLSSLRPEYEAIQAALNFESTAADRQILDIQSDLAMATELFAA